MNAITAHEQTFAHVTEPEASDGELLADALEVTMELSEEVTGIAGAYDHVQVHHSKALEILEYTSSLTLFSGPIAMHKAWKEIKIARVLKDVWREIKGWLDAVYGVVQTASGALFATLSAARIAFLSALSKAAEIASRILGRFGSSLSAIGFLCATFSQMINLPKRFHCASMILKHDMDAIRKELKDPKLARIWQEVLDEKTIEKIVSGEQITRWKLIYPMIQEIIHFFLILTGAVFSIIEIIAPTLLPVWILAVMGAGLGLLLLLNDGYHFFSDLTHEKMARWEKMLMIISSIFCLSISIMAFQHAATLLEKVVTLVAGCTLTLVHLIVIAKN